MKDERTLRAEDARFDQLVEDLVLAAYQAELPDDPAVQALVDELGEYVAETRARPTIRAAGDAELRWTPNGKE